jgi:hypothetical protein
MKYEVLIINNEEGSRKKIMKNLLAQSKISPIVFLSSLNRGSRSLTLTQGSEAARCHSLNEMKTFVTLTK